MEQYAIIGVILSPLLAVATFYLTQKRAMKEDLRKEAEAHERSAKEIQDLNKNIIELNVNFKNMLENDKVRDNRITKHGQEIESVIERQRENEHELANHETRISSLENWRQRKEI